MKDRVVLPSTDELLEKARSITGIDIVDDAAREPLSWLLKSYNEEVTLTAESARNVEKHLVLSVLCNRLRMQRDFAAHPEIHDQELQPPVFICGMARSGTTKLHKLLAASGDFNFLTFWRSAYPALFTGSRDESPAARIAAADEFVDWLNATSPELRFTHEQSTHEPEEENWVHNHSFTISFLGFLEMVAYPTWLSTWNHMKFQQEFLRDVLKYLQWQGYGSSSKPWVLKTILYYGNEPTIKEVFPDARFLMTHRPPIQTIPSLCSLLKAYSLPVSKNIDVPFSPFVDGEVELITRHLQHRRERKDIEWLDIHYTEHFESMENAMRRVYRHLGMSLGDAALHRMREWDQRTTDVKGRHRYTLADSGMTAEQINEKFSAYNTFLEERFGKVAAGDTA